MPPGPLLELAADLAEGLAAIHDATIAHRNLKPSDVILTADGPRVINYWISRAAGTGIPTYTGMVPGFTSPEQAAGHEATTASDVFSLAGILIFAATGNGPFATGTADAMNYQVIYHEPRLDSIPAEIRTLTARCLAKNPADRPSSRELLAELAYTRAGRSPVGTRPSTSTGALSNWAGSLTPSPAAAPATTIPLPPTQHPSSRRRLRTILAASLAAAALVTAVIALTRTTQSAGGANPATSGARPVTGVTPSAVASGAAITASPDGNVNPANVANSSYFAQAVYSVAFSPDGQTMATSSYGDVFLWNVASQGLITRISLPTTADFPVVDYPAVDAITFSPDGKTLATVDWSSGKAFLWSTASGSRIASFSVPGNDGLTQLAFSPDGKVIATEGASGVTYLWDAAAGARIAALPAAGPGSAKSLGAKTLAFSPDGKVIAVGDLNGSTYLWNVAARSVIARLVNPGSGPARNTGLAKAVTAVAFSPAGHLLATADATGSICLWNTANQHKLATLTEPDSQGLNSIAFSRDGGLLAAGDTNDTTYLWQISPPA